MAVLTHVQPHLNNTYAHNNNADPMFSSIFEVSFTLPAGLKSKFSQLTNREGDIVCLTSQVTQVSGLDALQKTVQAGSQKFYGADMSFLNPTLDNTYAELTVEFNLNLNRSNDAYVLNLFKAWESLGYDLRNGHRSLMADYLADGLKVSEANRDGSVWRSVVFNRVMVTSVTGIDTANYTDNEARKLTVTFRTDLWDEFRDYEQSEQYGAHYGY